MTRHRHVSDGPNLSHLQSPLGLAPFESFDASSMPNIHARVPLARPAIMQEGHPGQMRQPVQPSSNSMEWLSLISNSAGALRELCVAM